MRVWLLFCCLFGLAVMRRVGVSPSRACAHLPAHGTLTSRLVLAATPSGLVVYVRVLPWWHEYDSIRFVRELPLVLATAASGPAKALSRVALT